MAGSPGTWDAEAEIENKGYRLRFGADRGDTRVRLDDLATGEVLSGAAYVYRLTLPTADGMVVHARLLEQKFGADGESLSIRGRLGPLVLEQRLSLPGRQPWMEERIVLRNEGGAPVPVLDFEAGFLRRITDARGFLLPTLADDRLVAIPFRHRATDAPELDHDFTLREVLARAGQEPRPGGPFTDGGEPSFPGRHWYSEGWAWTHCGRTLGVFKHNPWMIEFSAFSTWTDPKGVSLRFGGAKLIGGDSSWPRAVPSGGEIAFGVTRYLTEQGEYTRSYLSYRAFLDENGCRFPDGYNPPVHWNELYDNPEWNLSTPGKPPIPRVTRPLTYTRALMEQEAAKGKAYSCEALYLDPGWDTDFGTLIWGEGWLGSRSGFVERMRTEYGLAVSLHCPLATWMSLDGRGVASWPREAFRRDPDGKVLENEVCLGSRQYLDEAARRLLASCEDGVAFLMFDGNWWPGACWEPAHGHPVPSTPEDHCRACLDLAQRVHAKHPDVLIEMHDMIAGGSAIRFTPVYFGYGPCRSHDENWGLELMWDSMSDIQRGRARALFYYNLACNIPLYLHVDLRDDNEHCLVLWWYASTCRHLGIGGTHEDPQIAGAQRRAMARYRSLERYFKRGEFHAMREVGLIEPTRIEEIHLHAIPQENALVVTLFNLSDEPRRLTGGIPADDLGMPLDAFYVMPRGCGFNPKTGWLHVDRRLPPWSAQVAEIRPLRRANVPY